MAAPSSGAFGPFRLLRRTRSFDVDPAPLAACHPSGGLWASSPATTCCASWPDGSAGPPPPLVGPRSSRTDLPARLSAGGGGDQVQVGDPVAEELAAGPAVGPEEPAGPPGGGDRDAVEAAVAGDLAAEPVPAEVPVPSGSPHRSSTNHRTRPAPSSP